MKSLADMIWNEPAVAAGLLGSLVVIGFKVASSEPITADDILAALAPLGAGALARQAVVPEHRVPQPPVDDDSGE